MGTIERWRPIPGYEGRYEASNLGRIRETRVLKTDGGGHRYPRVNIDGRTQYVHRLVALAFLGDPPSSGAVVNHKDFNRKNNSAENLEWVTQTENMRHAAQRMRKPKTVCRKSNTGHKYISYDGSKYRVQIKQIGADKRFGSLEESVEYRDEVMKTWRKNAFCADVTAAEIL